jgi:predicted nucleic acid-binding Zn ribbon protein
MAAKNSKSQKTNKSIEDTVVKRQKAAQFMFAAFAILLIISMVLSAVKNY